MTYDTPYFICYYMYEMISSASFRFLGAISAVAAGYPMYGAQNEAYMSRSAEKWVRGLCLNELGVSG